MNIFNQFDANNTPVKTKTEIITIQHC